MKKNQFMFKKKSVKEINAPPPPPPVQNSNNYLYVQDILNTELFTRQN